MIAVNTVYPGVSPADIETLVTRPIEDELNTIGDIKELTSTSVEGYSSVVAEFETSVNLEEALQKVREKVDLAKPELPEDAEDPSIAEFNFSEVPIMQVNLSGEYGLVRLKEIGEDLQDRLEQIPQVLRVDHEAFQCLKPRLLLVGRNQDPGDVVPDRVPVGAHIREQAGDSRHRILQEFQVALALVEEIPPQGCQGQVRFHPEQAG